MTFDRTQRAAIAALQDMSIVARRMAHESGTHAQLPQLLDDIDGLFGLLLSGNDFEPEFARYFRAMCDQYELEFYWTLYRRRLDQP